MGESKNDKQVLLGIWVGGVGTRVNVLFQFTQTYIFEDSIRWTWFNKSISNSNFHFSYLKYYFFYFNY